VLFRSVADFDLESAPGLYTHIKPIDNIIYKFLYGSVLLLTGIKGSGKSAFLNQAFVCESLQQGNDCFIFSAELGNDVLKSWIEIVMAGSEHIKMKDEFIHIIDKQTREKLVKWYNNRLWVYDQPDNNVDVVLDRAIAVTRKYGVKTWIIDNLMTLDINANDTNIWQKQKDFIVKLVGLAKRYNVLIVLVSHPRKTKAGEALNSDDISGASDLGNLSQYIVSVHRYSQKEKNGEKNNRGGYRAGFEPIEHDVKISILKNRYTGKIGDAKLYFNYPDYRFYSNTEELFTRYKWDSDNTKPIPTVDPNKHSQMPDAFKD
jgi:twinkle protein